MNARTLAPFLQPESTESGALAELTSQLASRAFVHAHAVHQDFLVQFYRVLVAAMHLAFLGAIAALAAMHLPVLVTLVCAVATAAAQQALSGRLMEMVLSRQADVDWSQIQVLVLEQQLPPGDRHFTRFKLYQDAKSSSVGDKERTVMAAQPATADQIKAYFESHSSPSRAKASRLLEAMRLLGVAVAILSVLAAALN